MPEPTPGVAEEPWVTAAIEAAAEAAKPWASITMKDGYLSSYTLNQGDIAGNVIRAALPIIEAGMREKIAREIEADIEVCPEHTPPERRGMWIAAAMVRSAGNG